MTRGAAGNVTDPRTDRVYLCGIEVLSVDEARSRFDLTREPQAGLPSAPATPSHVGGFSEVPELKTRPMTRKKKPFASRSWTTSPTRNGHATAFPNEPCALKPTLSATLFTALPTTKLISVSMAVPFEW